MPKPKGSSQGYVFFNKQRKKWQAQYSELDPLTGKMKFKSKSFNTKEDGEKYLKTIMYQKENTLYIENHGIPMIEILKQNAKQKLDMNLIGLAQYSRILKTISALEKTSFGNKNIDEITSEELQAYLNSLKTYSNSTIEKATQQLNQAFKTAIRKGFIMQDPMINVIRPRSNNDDKVVRALTIEEQEKLTNWLLNKSASEYKYKNVFLIQMYMGLRIGETLALTTHDIDLEHKKINVHRTITTDECNNFIMGNKTKTYAGKRLLPIPDFLLPYIIEQMKIANTQENNEEKLLFKPTDSKYARRYNVNNELKRVLKKEFGITDISTHSLRHTYGTRCIESGMAPVVVQKLMGHNDVSVTLNTYTSVFDQFKNKEIDKVNQYYLNENLMNTKTLNEKNDIEDEK